MALITPHHLGHLRWGDGVPDPPAGHGIGLAHAVDNNRPRLGVIAHHGDAHGFSRIDQFVIDLIRNDI